MNMQATYPFNSFLTIISHGSGTSAEADIFFLGFVLVAIIIFLYRRLIIPKMRTGTAKRFVLQNRRLAKETVAHIKSLCGALPIPFDVFLRVEQLDRDVWKLNALNEVSSGVDWVAARNKLGVLAEDMNRLAEDIGHIHRSVRRNSLLSDG